MTFRRAARLAGILVELERSFQRAPDGTRRASYAAAPGYAGRFYPAHERYLWTRNCNWWTVKRLAAAALAGKDAGVVFAGQVAGRLHGFQAPRIEAPST